MVDKTNCELFLKFCTFLVIICYSSSAERQVKLKKWNCPSPKGQITIVYIKAIDNEHKNIVHFIWSVHETPSIIVGYSSKYNFDPHSTLSIDCNKLTSENPKKAISWQYDYASAFEITEVDELHDPDDDVTFSKTDFDKTINHHFRDVVWKLPTITKDSEVTFQGQFLGGNITFTFNSSSKDGRGAEAPRQLYSNNGTRFSLTLEKIKFNTTETRVALKLLMHTDAHPSEKSTIQEDRSIDDEFSPGIFRTFVISHVLNSTILSFVSWKPVSYLKEKKGLDSQVPSYQYRYDAGNYLLYKKADSTSLVPSAVDKPSKVIQAAMDVQGTFPLMISFGQKKDGWYQKSNHLTWSGQVGYYKPQYDTMSKTLIVTIFVGLGLPVAFILLGSFYVCFKKYRERRTTSTYGKIN